MISGMNDLAPALAMLVVSVAMTLASLWIGGRVAPWFMDERFEPPTVRSYFLEPHADMELTRARVIHMMAAAAVLLAMLLVMAVAVRYGGLALV